MASPDFSIARLIQVQPDALNIQEQIFARGDFVHEIPDLSTLLTYRIGPDGYNRQCFCLVEDRDRGVEVLATIHTEFSTANTETSSPFFLRGNIRDVLTTPAKPLDGSANLITCYSISSFRKKAGAELIKRLYSHFNQSANPPVISTLSPIRTLGAFVQEAGYGHIKDPDVIRLCAAAHLLQKKNEVQNFHQGNGAYIGAIHVFANAAGGKDNVNGYDVMVGYRYPRSAESLSANQADFSNPNEKIIPVSGGLITLMEQAGMRFADHIAVPVDLSRRDKNSSARVGNLPPAKVPGTPFN